MPERFEVIGLNEAYRMLESLTAVEKQKIIVSILTKAANRNIKEPLKARNIFSSPRLKSKPFITIKDKNNPLGVISGISGKYFFYRFSEFGTEERYTKAFVKYKSFNKKTGKIEKKSMAKKPAYRGRMRKKPFVIQTIESNLKSIVNFFIQEYSKETKKKMDSLARKKLKS